MNNPTPPPSPPELPALPQGQVAEGQQGEVDAVQGPAAQGPADQGPADQGPADQGPAAQGPAPAAQAVAMQQVLQPVAQGPVLNEGIRGIIRGRHVRGGRRGHRGRGRAVHAFGAPVAHQPAPPVEPFPPPVEGEELVQHVVPEIVQQAHLRNVRRHRHGRGDASSVLEFLEVEDAQVEQEPQQGAGGQQQEGNL